MIGRVNSKNKGKRPKGKIGLKNKKTKIASPEVEPGSLARAIRFLTTAPQCHTCFGILILLY